MKKKYQNRDAETTLDKSSIRRAVLGLIGLKSRGQLSF